MYLRVSVQKQVYVSFTKATFHRRVCSHNRTGDWGRTGAKELPCLTLRLG